ncbi:MAG: sulfatase, partial [Endomicrobiales bacterium]|nr:sulfatase [Endomicrobiales bacterium]
YALGCYGSKLNVTPNIDKFAENAILFENAYSQEIYTIPSAISIFTSVYPISHKVFQFLLNPPFESYFQTIFNLLQDNGYKAVFFDDHKYFSVLGDKLLGNPKNLLSANITRNEDIIKWLDKNDKSKFIMFILDMQLHNPYFPKKETLKLLFNKELDLEIMSRESIENRLLKRILNKPEIIFTNKGLKKYKDILELNDLNRQKSLLIPILRNSSQIFFSYNDYFHSSFEEMLKVEYNSLFNICNNPSTEQLENLREFYLAKVYEFDQQFGQFLNILEKRNLLENTIIILMSMHGENFRQGNNIFHNSLNKDVIHVPLIISIPGKYKNLRIKHFVSLIDIMPTLLDLLSIHIPKHIDGASLLPYLKNKNAENDLVVYSEHYSPDDIDTYKISLINKKYHFITSFKSSGRLLILLKGWEALYDLENDPNEKINIASSHYSMITELNDKVLKKYRNITKYDSEDILPMFYFKNERN